MTEWGVDAEGANYWLGYMDGMVTTVKTTQYIGAAMEYASSYLSGRFESAMDNVARMAPKRFHHVYEWGSSYGSYETVGISTERLWKLIEGGQGGNRTVSYTFLPSHRPVPIEQELLVPGKRGRTVNEEVHIFTWKAMVMEYGLPVTIAPKLAKTLAFVGEDGKLVFTKKTIHTVPGKDDLAGNFTGFFVSWWTTVAPQLFKADVKPYLETSIRPKDSKGRFRKWTSMERFMQKGQSAKVMIQTYESAKAEAVKDMKQQQIDYIGRAGQRRMDLYGY